MVAVTVAALPIAALVVWVSLRTPLARRVVATPTVERWHEVETPSIGGVGIFAGILAGVGLAVATGALDATDELWGVLGACGLLFAVGLADDLRGLRPLTKLIAQLGAVTIVLAAGVRVEAVNAPVLAYSVAVLWLVGMTNALNLLDNMNGVAATLSAIACGLFAIDAVSAHPSRLVLVLSLSVGCACLGFLPFNLRRKAAVFMGDSGSQVLGFALGSLALLSTWKAAAPSLAAVVLPVLVLAVPILDTALVMVVRLVERRPVYAGGRDHTAHRLVHGGLSERRTVVFLALVAAVVGSLGLAYSAVDNLQLTLAGVIVTFAILVQFAGTLAGVDEGATGRWNDRLHWGRALELLVDGVLITGAFAAAFALRFRGVGTDNQRDLFAATLPVLLAARYAIFILCGLYTNARLQVGVRGIARIAVAVVVSEGLAVALIAISDETTFATFSRSVFAIDMLFCTAVIVASRYAILIAARLLGRSTERSERGRTLVAAGGGGGSE
jgi:UDP-GlcNAc:undecaprenyl-phosphate/decaprenyl-phosphate GlcNAc-1-phosphate transferase